MISTLQELVAPLTLGEFSERLNSRTYFLQRSSGESRFKELFDWERLLAIIESGALPPDKFRVTKNTNVVPPVFYLKNGKTVRDSLDKLFSNGASLLTNPIETLVPGLKLLCADIHSRTGDAVNVDAVATTGAGGAVKVHFDFADLIVVQLQGSKRWRLYGPPVHNPIKGMQKLPAPDTAPVFDEVLHAGDLLFLPSGYWHHCDNGPELSLHLGILMRSPTGWYAVKELLTELLSEDLFRVPLTRCRDDGEKAALVTELKSRLVAKIERMNLAELPEDAGKGERGSEDY